EQILVRGFVEADDQGPLFPERRRAQIAGRPEQQRQQLGARGVLAAESGVDDALALGDIELVHVLQHAERGVTLDGGLLGICLGADSDLVLGKEPLRFGAGHSAVPVVTPVDGAHAGLPDALGYYVSPIAARSSCQRRWRSAGSTSR